MNRNEYLYKLYYESGFMLSVERRRMLDYFRSYFIPGMDETLICKRLGEPKAALKVYLEKGIHGSESNIMRTIENVAWLLLAPAIADAAIVASAVIAILIIVAFCLFAFLPIIAVGLWMGGIGTAISTIVNGGGAGAVLSGIGGGLVMSGIGLLLIVGIFKLYRKMLPALARESRAAFKRGAAFLKKTKR